MPNVSQSMAIQQFQALGDGTHLVVIHPNYYAQHLLLNEFLTIPDAVYVRFSGNKLNKTELRQQMNETLERQSPGASLSDLNILLLDECDRGTSKALDVFLPEVVAAMPKGRVIVVSRVMPQCILNNDDLRAQTRFIPTDDGLMLWDYARRQDDAALLEVRAFGSGQVLLNGKSVDNWDGLLPRSLFFYLVDRGMTTRNDIFATFWPNLPIREATNVFHVTKRKINEVLGTDLTVYWSGFYRISPQIQLSYDAVQFSEMVQNSIVVPDQQDAITLIQRAVSLYRGDFLKSLNAVWVEKRRDELLQEYVEALVSLARLMEVTQHIQDALGLYIRSTVSSPRREDLVQNIMRLYRSLDMNADALAAYRRLEDELNRSLKIAPGDDIRKMAAAIEAQMNR